MRKGEQARNVMANNVNSRMLKYGVEVRIRWAEYFEQFFSLYLIIITIITTESWIRTRNEMKMQKKTYCNG